MCFMLKYENNSCPVLREIRELFFLLIAIEPQHLFKCQGTFVGHKVCNIVMCTLVYLTDSVNLSVCDHLY